MQTVCAHCYTFLSHRRQRMACILCTACEQNWNAGNAPQRGRKLPAWKGEFASVFGQEVSLNPSSNG